MVCAFFPTSCPLLFIPRFPLNIFFIYIICVSVISRLFSFGFASVQTLPSVFARILSITYLTPLHPTLSRLTFPLLLYSPCFVFFCLPGTPVFPLFPLWHHPVPPTASLCHRSGAGCLGFSLSGQEAARDSFDFKRRLLEGLEVPLAGVRYHSNPAPRVANLGPHWLKSASHPLPNSALCGL